MHPTRKVERAPRIGFFLSKTPFDSIHFEWEIDGISLFYLGGKSGGKSKNPVKSQVGTPSAKGRNFAKFPSIRETPKGKTVLRGTFCMGATKASNPRISSQTETFPTSHRNSLPHGNTEKSSAIFPVGMPHNQPPA